MKLINHIFCVLAMCCHLLSASGLVFHSHVCEDSEHCEGLQAAELASVTDSCCEHSHNSDEAAHTELIEVDDSVYHDPHHHPCNCQLTLQLPRTLVNVGLSGDRKVSDCFISTHADRNFCHLLNPSQAPPEKLLYVPPPLGASGVALIHIHCVYLI